MRTIETIATITEEGILTAPAPPGIPPGRRPVVIVIDEAGDVASVDTLDEFPVHDVGPWPEGLSLRREDLYDDQGR